MNAKKICLILSLLLVLSIGVVNAQEDFTATSSRSVELCPCSNQAYTVTVQNTGTVASSYTVLASGDAAEWATFSPDRFILSPGQRGSFSVSVNSLCDVAGDHDLEIFVTTSNGLTKVVQQVLKFDQCYDYSLEQGQVIEEAQKSLQFSKHAGAYNLCKDEQTIIPILITNKENFENRYKILLDAPEWAKLNVNDVSLGAEKSGIFLIDTNTVGIEGEFKFKLSTISELGEVQRKGSIEVNVEDCYILEVDLEKEKDVVCGGEDTNYIVTIKNPGTLEKEVDLQIEGPEWAKLENGSFNLKSERRKTAVVNVNPSDDVSGSFLIEVFDVAGNKTGLNSDKINIDVVQKRACYNADIGGSASITNFYSQDLFSVKVENDGIRKSEYNVNLESEPWIDISPDTLELKAGQTGNLNLNVNPGTDVNPGSYNIKINLETEDEIYSKDITIVLKNENEIIKNVKEFIGFYKNYFYVLMAVVVLILVLIKPLNKSKNKLKSNYDKYKVKKERLEALKLARKEKEVEKRKKKDSEEKRKPKERKKKSKSFFDEHRIWSYIVIILTIAVIGIFVGHANRLFNAKYLHIYLFNIFYGNLYYILIGAGVVAVLFLLLLLYNFISKKQMRKKVKETKRSEKKSKRKIKWYNTIRFRIAILVLIIILAYFVNNLDLFNSVKDFLLLYQYYFVSGVLILILIIFLIRFYKPLFKFLKE